MEGSVGPSGVIWRGVLTHKVSMIAFGSPISTSSSDMFVVRI